VRVSERGSAVPFAIACLGVLVLVGSGLGVAGALVVDHRAAQGAADLAALAGAAAIAHGSNGCDAAARTAAGNGAALEECRAGAEEVRVIVVVSGPRWLGNHADLRGEARAGPG
jgi:secretion/DNA translocation related TadE-like protein